MFNNYQMMSNFCPIKMPTDDPVTYCVMDDNNSLNHQFSHGAGGGSLTPYSKPCQAFMSSRCSTNWDDKCELASKNTETRYPNMIAKCGNPPVTVGRLSAGDILVMNTAEKKYGKLSGNCSIKQEPFDPTVLTSPMVEYQVSDSCSYGGVCKTIYDVDPNTIDNDPVMNKILDRPEIGASVLVNIYRQLKKRGELAKINNTRLGRFYQFHREIFA